MKYRHDNVAFVLTAIPLILVIVLNNIIASAEFVRGGDIAKFIFLLAFIPFYLFFIYVYRNLLLCRYIVTEQGLILKRPFKSKFIKWERFSRINMNQPFGYITFYSNNTLLFFVSTHYFSKLPDLLSQIYLRSECAISDNLSFLAEYENTLLEKEDSLVQSQSNGV
jgi:hypothetical protein